MGAHMLPGRERWRARRRSIRFTMAAILSIPVIAVLAMWGFAGVILTEGLEHNRTAQHGTVLIRVALADAVGLAAVLAAAVAMYWFARRVSRDVSSLETTARRFADQQFPNLMAQLRRGEQVSQDSDLSPVASARITEIARAAEALASVQRTAVAAAVTEISLRSGVSQVFVSLARRNQSLLQRQLRLLDDLERKAADPGALADLFPLDHLTTRMRRHAEGLIILSGAVPGRGWSRPVPVIDVIRGAIAEVEDYKRIAVVTNAEDMVAGSAVADMIHLLAELIENAAMFSPSGTRVEVRAERVGNGFAFEIEDRGLGIKSEELDTINERLGNPADFDLANTDQLGLFVVGKLAARHGVRVFLRPSPYGGTTAIVVMPRSMITPEAETPAEDQPAEEAAALGRAVRGRPEDLQLALTGRQMRRTPPTAGDIPARPGSGRDEHGSIPGQSPFAQPGPPVFAGPPDTSTAHPEISTAHPEAGAGHPDLSAEDADVTAVQPVFPAPPDVTAAQPVFPAPPDAAVSPAFPAPPDAGPDQASFFRLGTGPVLPTSPSQAPSGGQPSPGQPWSGQPSSGFGSATLPTRHGARNARPSLFQPRTGQPGSADPPASTGPANPFDPPASTGPADPFGAPASTGPADPFGAPASTGPADPFEPSTGSWPSDSFGSPASQDRPASPAQPGPSLTAGTHRGLPRRVRQANLSPHLRNSASSASATPASGPAARSPEQAKSLLSSLQRGWERGREAGVPDSETTATSQDAGGDVREASQEET
jgi:signal transduction histidine kinase